MSSNLPWKRNRGLLLAVAAPSGAGKTTLCVRMTERFTNLRYATSYTTRKPRDGEVDGQHYYFVDPQRFRQMIADDAFLEWAEVHGNFYGTPKVEVEAMRQRGIDVLLDLDVQGVETIKGLAVGATFCMVLPPSYQVLRQRLEHRGKDTPEEVERRMTIAVKEVARIDLFDYVIVNDDLDEASLSLESIIRSEHARRNQIDDDWFYDAFSH